MPEATPIASGQQLIRSPAMAAAVGIVGWFVRYIKSGPVGSGSVETPTSIGVQLIR